MTPAHYCDSPGQRADARATCSCSIASRPPRAATEVMWRPTAVLSVGASFASLLGARTAHHDHVYGARRLRALSRASHAPCRASATSLTLAALCCIARSWVPPASARRALRVRPSRSVGRTAAGVSREVCSCMFSLAAGTCASHDLAAHAAGAVRAPPPPLLLLPSAPASPFLASCEEVQIDDFSTIVVL